MDGRPSACPAVLAGLLLLCGCGSEPPVPMLHALPDHAGLVKIAERGGTTECQIAFHRDARRLQAQLDVEGRQVTVVRDPEGRVTAFEAAVERPIRETERERFALIEALVDPAAIEAVEPGADSYRVRVKGRWYGVEVEARHGADFHHR